MRYYKYTTLGFAETEEQWQVLGKCKSNHFSDLQIIAVTPEVDYLAECSGKPYLTVEDFCSWEELCNLGDANIDRVEQLCDELDKLLYSVAHKMPNIDIVSTKAFFHPIKGFFDSLTLRTIPIEAAFKFIQPSLVICFLQPEEYKITGPNLLDKPSLSLTSRIAPIAAEANHFKTIWIQNDKLITDRQHNFFLKTESFQVRQSNYMGLNLDERVNLFRETLQRNAPYKLFEFDKPLLLSERGCDDFNDKILMNWKNHKGGELESIGKLYAGTVALDQNDQNIVNSIHYDIGQLLWNGLHQNSVIRRLFKIGETDMFALSEPLLRLFIVHQLPNLLLQAPLIERNVSQLKRAVVMTGGMVLGNSLVAKACDKHKVPVVSSHRGNFMGYSLLPFHERYDLADADYYICNGIGNAETLKYPSPMSRWCPERKRAIPVVIGAAWLDELVAKCRKEKPQTLNKKVSEHKTIMYVMPEMIGDNCYLGYTLHPEIWLRRFEFELIRILTAFPDIELLLKPPLANRFPYIANPIFNWVEERHFKNVRVFQENVPLENITHLADAFIVVTPSVPLQVLVATEKPFIAYIDRSFFKLVPEAAELLKKRSILADTRYDFFIKLEDFLRNPDWILPESVNDEFLCHHATYLNDGKSAERTAEFLFQLATGTYNLDK